MNKIKQSLLKTISMMLVVVMCLTSITLSDLTSKQTKAATAYYPTLSFNLGKLSEKNAYLAKVLPKEKSEKTASICSINMAGSPVFCMLLGGSLSMYNAFYTADINKYGKSYQKYFRGAIYYYEDKNDEFALSKRERYVVSQIIFWRILKIRSNNKAGTYNNIMDGFEDDFKSIMRYWGEADAGTAWNEIKQVMQWVNNDYEKVDKKHVTLYLWTHMDGTQPLLRGKVEPFEEKAYIAVQKKGVVNNANVKDAEFGIYSKKSCKDASFICKITTDKEGYAITSNSQAKKLKPNTTYFIKELKAPAGSELNKEVFNVKTAENNSTVKKAVKITVSDKQYRIKINTVKVEKDNSSKKLSGAIFRVYQWNISSKKYETYKDYITDNKGQFTTEWLYYTKTNGGKYRIEEIKAPAGYKVNGLKKDVQINKNNNEGMVKYTAENEPSPGWIEIHKSASIGDKDVSEEVNLTATFTIYSDIACTKYAGSITTNRNGYGKSGDLKPGIYYIKETKWIKRLKPSFRGGEKVEVKPKTSTKIYGEPGKFAEQMPDSIGIKLTKVDADNNLLTVQGAEFGIYEWNGLLWTLKYREKSNAAGIVEIPAEDNKLYYTEKNQGKFKVVELSAPPDYIVDSTPRYVTITDENANTTVNLGTFENTPKKGTIEIQKIIATAEGKKVTDIPLNSPLLNITYGLFTDEGLTNAVNNSIKLDKNGHAKIENLSAGIYYLKETSCNNDIFAGSTSIDTRYIKIIVKRNNITYVDGERGYSEDGSTWIDCWSNVVTTSNISALSVADNLVVDGLISAVSTTSMFGSNEYTTVSRKTEEQKTINDVKDNWKKLSDEQLDKVLDHTEDAELAEFIICLSQEDLQLILEKETRFTEPYTTYKVVDETGTLKKTSEEIYWKYLMEFPYQGMPMTLLTRKRGYFYINISGDGKTTSLTVNVSVDSEDFNTESPIGITISVSGTNNHGVSLEATHIETELSAGDEYNIICTNFSYTKPAHYVSSGEGVNYAVNSKGNAMACHFNGTINNSGHNTANVAEMLQAYINIANAGLIDLSGKAYHATLQVNLSRQYGGIRVDPNGGNWKNGSTTFISDTGPYWSYACGMKMSIANPSRPGYTFKGWSVTNGVDAHGSLSGNVYGETITSANSIFTCGGNASSVAQGVKNGYYTTLTANWQVNQQEVTGIDVATPNVLKNVLKMIELDIIKTDVEDETETIDARFDVLEWSEEKQMYIPYLKDIKAQERVFLRLSFDNRGKYHVVETWVQNTHIMSQTEADISIYNDNTKSIPYYENTLGVNEDLGVFVSGRGYNEGDIVRDKNGIENAIWYRCLVANIGKDLNDVTYWQKITASNYNRYEDLVNGAGVWDNELDVCTVMAVHMRNIKDDTPGHTNLFINKKNSTGNILEGAKFAAYYIDGTKCKDFEFLETQYYADQIDISNMQTYSTYDEKTGIRTLNLVIKEEKVPFGYIKDKGIAVNITIKSKLNADNEWEAISKTAVFDDGTTQDIISKSAITVVNENIKLNIYISKKSSEASLPLSTLEGAVYGIYDNAECTSLVDKVTIDGEGNADITGLSLRDYWVKEISAPTSGLYRLSDEVKHVDVSELYDQTESAKVLNAYITVADESYLGEILVKKYGYTDSTLTQVVELKAVGFTLYALPEIPKGMDEDKYVMSYDFRKATAVRKEVKTDSQGIARFEDLPMGDYVAVETTVPNGYVKNGNRIVHLTKEYAGNNDDTAYPLVIYNETYSAPIKIYKISSNDEIQYLEGAVFRIFDVNANGYIAETMYETDQDGNEKESIEPKLYTTDKNGFVLTEKLKEGTYRIEEVSSPAGYVLNNKTVEVTIKDGAEDGVDEVGHPYYEVTMKNKPTDTYFTKVDITTKEEIKGGYYTVTDTLGNIFDEWEGTGEEHHIYGLVIGEEYILTEKVAPEGYVVAESITFKINEDGTPTNIVIEDDYNKLEISKQDITSEEELSGAHLQIIDEEGKVIDEWISTITSHRIDRIPVGAYTLKETQAPDGYIISEEITFEVGESTEVQKVVMYDDYTKTAFIKLAEDTQEPLVGCVLQVIDKSGKVVDEWTTDGEIHYTYKLTKGETYTLHETTAPNGYEIAENIKFIAGEEYVSANDKELQSAQIVDKEGIGIDDDSYIKEEDDTLVEVESLIAKGENDEYTDDILIYTETENVDVPQKKEDELFDASEFVTVTMTDSPLEIIPEKVDENGNPVYGAVLRIIDEKGNVVYEWETDIMQTQGFKVVPGIYTIHEVSAPAGYRKFEDTKITMTNKDVAVKLVDHTMKATITKIDKDDKIKLPNTGGTSLKMLIFAVPWLLLVLALFTFNKKKKQK